MTLNWHKQWLIVGYCLIVSVVAGSLLPPPMDSAIWRYDKIIHAGSYALLMGWFLQIYQKNGQRLLLVLAFAGLGIGLEVAQSFHPMRRFDYWDMLANSVGVVIAWLLGFSRFGRTLQYVDHWLQSRH